MASKYRIHSDEWPGLIKLAEECSELSHAALKIMGGTDSPEQVAHLEDEIGDVFASLAFLMQHNDLNRPRISSRRKMKQDRWLLRRGIKRNRSACNA